MPFYEYECSACKYYVEVLRKISDPPMIKCPSCGKDTLQRLLSAPVFRLKGSGWYETDFKSDKEQKRNIAGEPKAPPEKKEGDDTSKPEVRTRKKTSVNAKSASVPAGSPATKTPVKTAASPAATKAAKKAALKTTKKSAQKPAAKSLTKNKSTKKAGGKQKAVRKAIKKTSKAPRKPKSAAKKK